jgi:hypothetical protein
VGVEAPDKGVVRGAGAEDVQNWVEDLEICSL